MSDSNPVLNRSPGTYPSTMNPNSSSAPVPAPPLPSDTVVNSSARQGNSNSTSTNTSTTTTSSSANLVNRVPQGSAPTITATTQTNYRYAPPPGYHTPAIPGMMNATTIQHPAIQHPAIQHHPSSTTTGEFKKTKTSKRSSNNLHPIIFTPNDIDVLYGAPFNTSSHPGNVRYRQLLKSLFNEYQHRSPSARLQVLDYILDEITKEGGRFLMFNHYRKGYVILSSGSALEKVQTVMEECLKRSNDNRNDKEVETTTATMEGTAQDHRVYASSSGPYLDRIEPPKAKKIRTKPKEVVVPQPPLLSSEPSKAVTTAVSNTNKVTQSAGVQFHSTSDSTNTNTNYTDSNPRLKTNSTSNTEDTVTTKCDKCQGTGFYPVPSHLNASSADAPIQPINDPSVATSTISQVAVSTGDLSSWSNQLREVESQFGVVSDQNMDYPNRIKEIERVASQQTKQQEKFKLPSILQTEEIEHMIRLVEQAEERWGIVVPENFNLAQRIELIEKTAFNFMARLQVWL